MLPINGFIIASFLVGFSFLFGTVTFINDYDTNPCEMTFMFEYPQYVKISMKDKDNGNNSLYEKYGLYSYSEGSITEKARNMYFDGIPVLFIPGNAGSYKQVRSLASIALRKSLNSRPGYHFNYFSVDLNEELSGFNGALLFSQVEFVNKSIKKILELYEERDHKPKSVILVGHSMGGLIATKILSSLPKNSTLIPLVITLSTPHTRMPILFDKYMSEFYDPARINMGVNYDDVYPYNSVIVSISGGYYDFLVPPSTTKAGDVHIVSTHIPRSWVPMDHLCILWCKQFVLAVNRAIFDSVDVKTKQISDNKEVILRSFNHHLVKHSGTNVRLASRYNSTVYFNDDDAQWTEYLARQFDVQLEGNRQNKQIYMIRLIDHPMHEAVTLLGINMDSVEWVFACPAVHMRGNSRICKEGVHLTQLSEIAPSIKYKRRMLKINLHEIQMNYSSATHVIAKIAPSNKPAVLYADIYGPGSRKIPVSLPKWFSMQKHVLIKETAKGAIHYNLVLPELNHVRQSYLLYVEPLKCRSVQNHHAVATILVPWSNQNYHAYFTETEKKPMQLRLYMSRPPGVNDPAIVQLTLDPTCQYSVSVKASISGTLSQISRHYLPLLISNVAAVLLLTLRSQLQAVGDKQRCSFFFTALKEGAKPYYVITIVKFSSKLLTTLPLSIAKYIPVNDWKILEDDGSEFLWLPFLLYMCSVSIVWIIGANLAFSLILCESTVHKVVLKFFAKSMTGTTSWSDWLMSNLQKLPLLVASVLIMISWTACGGLALCLGTFFYFLKITQMSQDVIEDFVWRIVKAVGRRMKNAFNKRKNKKEIKSANDLLSNKEDTTNNTLALSAGTSSNTSNNKELALKNKDNDRQIIEETNMKTKTDVKDNISLNKNEVEIVNANCDKDEDKDENKTGENDNHEVVEVKVKDKKVEMQELVENENAPNKKEEKKEGVAAAAGSLIAEIFENNELYFHITIFMLWAMVAILNIPVVLTWAKNYKFSRTLSPDPSFIPGFILGICALPLWHFEFPNVDKLYYKQLNFLIYGAAVISLLFGSVTVYRLNYTLIFVIASIIIHQLFAPNKPQENDVNEEDDKKEEEKEEKKSKNLEDEEDFEKIYENAKAKMD